MIWIFLCLIWISTVRDKPPIERLKLVAQESSPAKRPEQTDYGSRQGLINVDLAAPVTKASGHQVSR